jgi:hypothetical protein
MLKHARGQHRRSKRTSTLAISGLTTAILAGGGLLAAGPASAAAGWDAVAQCESGGNAKYNDGQFYGLYNFDRGTWNGTGRSGTADQYSAAEQQAAAQQLYSQRGSSPWPVCGKYLSGGSTASTASRSVSRAPVASAPTKATTSTRKAPAAKASSSTSAGVAYLSQRYIGTDRADVRTLQQRLVAKGYAIAVDGRYGPQTEGAVRGFQDAAHVQVDGIAGPQTQHACGMI